MAFIKKINIKGTEYDIHASQLGNSLKVGAGDNSLIINEGIASSNTSIAGGTTDKTILDGLLGGLAGTTAALSLKESEAKGALSISLGANNRANTGGSVALGYDNVSGGKGYYVTSIDTTNKTITLSTKQTSTSSPGNPSWNKGDKLFFVNDDRYWLEVAAKTSSNVVTVVDMPFTSLVSVNSLTSKPNERAIINVTQPESGTVDIGWGAIGIGTQNIVVGSNAYTVGYKNTVAGDFGAAFGQENLVGYSAFATGIKNEVTGKASFVSGQNNICTGNEALVGGGEENTVKVNRSLVAGSNHTVEGGPYDAVFGLGNKIETLSEGHELIAGWDNTLSAGGFGAILGVRGKNVSGNHNLILGRDNTNTAGARNVISGDVNEVVSGNQNIITGKTNKVTGSNNNVSGESNTNASGHQNIIGGYLNTNNGRNNLVAGESNNITSESSNDNIVSGLGNTLSGSNNILSGNSNTISTKGYGSLVSGRGNTVASSMQGNLVFGNYNSSSITAEGLELISGNDNFIQAGGYGAIIGSRNSNISGNQNFISGADNSCSGARNILSGQNNIINQGSKNIVSGQHNQVSGDNNLVVGIYNNISQSTTNAIVCGQYSSTNDDTLFAVGNGTSNDYKNAFGVTSDAVHVGVDFYHSAIYLQGNSTTVNGDAYVYGNITGHHDSEWYVPTLKTENLSSGDDYLYLPTSIPILNKLIVGVRTPIACTCENKYFKVPTTCRRPNCFFMLELIDNFGGGSHLFGPMCYKSSNAPTIQINTLVTKPTSGDLGQMYITDCQIVGTNFLFYGYESTGAVEFSAFVNNIGTTDLFTWIGKDGAFSLNCYIL